jgi:hypothetical protein
MFISLIVNRISFFFLHIFKSIFKRRLTLVNSILVKIHVFNYISYIFRLDAKMFGIY